MTTAAVTLLHDADTPSFFDAIARKGLTLDCDAGQVMALAREMVNNRAVPNNYGYSTAVNDILRAIHVLKQWQADVPDSIQPTPF